MTAHELARQECEKYRSDGTCPRDNVTIRDGVMHFAPYPRCNLALGKPCQYFEESLLPWAETTTDKRREMELRKAKNQYEEMKHEYERTVGRCDLERIEDGGTVGMHSGTSAFPGTGGRSTKDKGTTRIVRILGARRVKMA